MPLSPLPFWILALLLLREAFLEDPIESLTEIEGQDLDLHCAVAGDNTSDLEWSNPKSVIFFNHQQAKKDKRYKLISSSKDHLSIRLSNVTTDDEGLYTCQHYNKHVNSTIHKQVKVTILAAPSKPLLEKSVDHSGEQKTILRCSTWGSKPPPQITWLMDNGIELFGETQHRCEGNRKKCNATSTLTVHTFNQKSTMTCVVRHKALRSGNFTAAVHLSHINNVLNVTEGNFRTQRPSPSSEPDTPNSVTPSSEADTPNSIHDAESDDVFSVTEGNFGDQTTSAKNEMTIQNPDSDSGSGSIFDIMQESPSTQATSTNGKAGAQNFTAANDPDKILNKTEGNSTIQTTSPSPEVATLNCNVSGGTNLTHEGSVMEPSKLLPILVATLLSVLFVAVLLLWVKLWRAHREWKRENDSSELTLESYKARTNEDNHVQKNRQVVGWMTSMKRAAEGSRGKHHQRNSEESNGSVFEKQLPA